MSPLGDPPLFIGFLKGVDFFWTTRVLALPTLGLVGALLAIFYLLDRISGAAKTWRRPPCTRRSGSTARSISLLIGGVVGAVLLSGIWKPGIAFDIAGTPLELQNLARDVMLVGLALLSIMLTPRAVRDANAFQWEPIAEVAKMFAGIFLTIIPVDRHAARRAGGSRSRASSTWSPTARPGEPRQMMYFWMTGLLSAFLDNAPTYLVFFNLAGGDPAALM